jgi:hypothetical protein
VEYSPVASIMPPPPPPLALAAEREDGDGDGAGDAPSSPTIISDYDVT